MSGNRKGSLLGPGSLGAGASRSTHNSLVAERGELR
jgi:hypothetical protein